MDSYLFVTGKLAVKALERTLKRMAPDFDYDITVLKCSVAALMNTDWIAARLPDAGAYTSVMIPGLCKGDLAQIEQQTGLETIRGPKDLKDLPVYFGGQPDMEGYGRYRTKILAEIVDAHEMSVEAILEKAEYYRRSGADIIDIGCSQDGGFAGVEHVVAALKKRGFIVSLDTFDPETTLNADKAGLDMLLSVNGQNLDLARKIRAKVVVIPDFGEGLESLERNAAQLEKWGLPFVMDPILDPMCLGFTHALERYIEVRRRHPQAEMLMGLGNLTELIDADSTGINALMMGVAAELDLDYVLTTEVISWARGAVKELDLSRKLMHFALDRGVIPKKIDDRLIAFKDTPFETYEESELREIQAQLEDTNYRIFTDDRQILVFNRDLFIKGDDPQILFGQLEVKDAAHAFYLGRELERAALALRLGKKYVQEQGLRWGYLDEM